jgi:pyruvate/2-oxoglutarate dehydrogenase complex dihydrolipoamide dehydrogenase (E3) component
VAARFAAAGKSVAIIERHLLGGTCVNTGCTPTKTLIASARIAYDERATLIACVAVNRADGIPNDGSVGLRLSTASAASNASRR